MIGVFKRELKRRFICEVEIGNKTEECYMSSSCHLLPMIDLIDKKVFLTENKGRNLRTKYTVQALLGKEKILLNLNYINNLVLNWLTEKNNPTNILREYRIEQYKSDFFISDTNTIIEAKGLLSKTNVVKLPSIYGERSIRQLKSLNKLLKDGYNVSYYLILLNPNISEILLNSDNKEYCKLFKACIKKGLTLKYFKVKWVKNICYLQEITNDQVQLNCN